MTWRHKKIISWWEKKCGARKCCSLLVKIMLVLVEFLWIFCQLPLELSVFLYFSVPQCQGWIWLFSIRGSKLNNLSTKRQSPCQIWIVEQQNHPFFANWTDWVLSSAFIACDSWIICLFISPLIPLRPLVGLRPPSKFLHSLTLPHYYHCISTSTLSQNTTPEGILSKCWCSLILWHSQPQWVYGMVRVPRDLDCTLLLSNKKSFA